MGRLAERASQRLQRSWWQAQPDTLAHLLKPFSSLYEHGVERARRRPAQRVGVPVVVVGNLIVGGAGKTPTVISIVQSLRAAGWTPGVISRGYGRRPDSVTEVTDRTGAAECGDEPLLIRWRASVPVMVGRDRVVAARALLERHPAVDVLVSDDGLQHWRLARDVQVIVFDERGAGNGRLLPAGPLREPLPASLPPSTFVLYNAPQPSTPLPGWTALRKLAGVLPLAQWREGAPAQPLEVLRGRPLLAAAGIADPERFFRMLEAEGLRIERRALPDHHDFEPLPWDADTPEVVVTEKDAVKLTPGRLGATRVWVAALDFRPDPAFNAALLRALPAR